MRIGVVSDTHLHRGRVRLPAALLAGLEGVDRILHAGDWIDPEVAEQLGALAPVDGVAGNNDGWDIIDRFGTQKLLRLGSFAVGIVHGHAGPGRSTEDRAYRAFAGEKLDVIVFGHSHVPYMEERDGVLLFNPGSPTDKRREPLYSYGILELADGRRPEARHYFYADKL